MGPGFWKVDTALARVLRLDNTRTLELRVEAFNLFNNFNWGDPTTTTPHFRPDYDSERRFTYHAVRNQIRLFGETACMRTAPRGRMAGSLAAAVAATSLVSAQLDGGGPGRQPAPPDIVVNGG